MTSKKLYRSRNGVLCGVCRGFAEYFNLSLTWIRIGFIVSFAITFFFPTGLIYLILALLMKKEPAVIPSQEESPFEYAYSGSRKAGLNQLKGKFSSLEKRIRRMESHVTNRAYDWDKRLNAD